ncbi:hypothetical protein NIES4071_81390 [Calothrix sp. NIES-4071]|nr:hypothetical protein NIES4071_81390 [Calothrix sp. NIES-4071]BAZ62408.1 hypothetical protein NIES4105_81320 [Calothrix sp. NIES-4105]
MLKFIQQQFIYTKTKRWFGIRRRWFILILLSFWFIVSLWQAPTVSLSKSTFEIRGIWITNFGVALNYYTTRLDEAVANIAKHNLNIVYPAVWNRGYTLHQA